MSRQLSPDQMLFFRNQLREVRARAQRDLEAFQEIMYVIERLGSFLSPGMEQTNLGKYEPALADLAEVSYLANGVSGLHRQWHVPFETLYRIVKDGRNDALHQGAYARHLTEHAVLLALILEDALMAEMAKVSDYKVSDYMVWNPTCAMPWQPVSFARQQMLANSFTYLPIRWGDEKKWCLIADFHIAQFLRGATSNGDRNQRLGTLLEDAINQAQLQTIPAIHILASDSIDLALGQMMTGHPLLVVSNDQDQELIGILAPFDLL